MPISMDGGSHLKESDDIRSSHLSASNILEPVEDVFISQQSSGSSFELLGPFSYRYKSFVLAMLLCVQFGFEHHSRGFHAKVLPKRFVREDPPLLIETARISSRSTGLHR